MPTGAEFEKTKFVRRWVWTNKGRRGPASNPKRGRSHAATQRHVLRHSPLLNNACMAYSGCGSGDQLIVSAEEEARGMKFEQLNLRPNATTATVFGRPDIAMARHKGPPHNRGRGIAQLVSISPAQAGAASKIATHIVTITLTATREVSQTASTTGHLLGAASACLLRRRIYARGDFIAGPPIAAGTRRLPGQAACQREAALRSQGAGTTRRPPFRKEES
jgi:hypothetical protein